MHNTYIPWHRPIDGVSDIERLRHLVDTDAVPGREELLALFPNRAYGGIQKQLLYLRNPEHKLRPLVMQSTQRPKIPASTKPILNEQVHLPGPSCLYLSDIHLPYQASAFIEQCVDLATSWGVDTLAIAGDFLDIEVYSKFDHEPSSSLEEELAQGEQMLEYLADRFTRIEIFLGNHEQRLFGATMHRQLRAERFLRMLTSRENINISGYEWMSMDSPQGLYRFCHPMNASLISGRVPAIIASRRFTDSHIISGHGHLKGMVKTEDGKRWAIDSGCCMDFERVPYVQMRVNTRPRMNQGAVCIRDGWPYPLEPQADWDALKRMYPAKGTAA